MAAVSLVPADLTPFAEIDEAKALAMIEDVMARAARVAPCILSDEFEHDTAARAILRGVILRWNESGTGAFVQEQLGSDYSYTTDTRQTRKALFWPSEIEELQKLCAGESSGAFTLDMVSTSVNHADICAVNFGANYCSCGADLTRYDYPLYETGGY